MDRLKADSLLIIDEDLVKNIRGDKWRVIKLPISRRVEEVLGTRLPANVAMLGIFSKITGIVTIDALEKAVREAVKHKYIDLNVRALHLGYNMV